MGLTMIPTQKEWRKTKKHNKEIDKKIKKLQERIDYINSLHWEKESLFQEKYKLERQYKLP